MRWTDVTRIAEELADSYPALDVEKVQYIRFTDLHAKVMALPGFKDAADRSNEKILEAIQAAWLDEISD
jgi:FeS assembly protein IscX